ncbi:type IV secretion system protein VirB10 [Acidovorax sp. LjRoot129]|uniref:type IV secretion system protein VirB10 n=1 Tax=Acidovorax sp. LjRoot129 TaxID=3342260 RepID=UPI003ED0BBD7
MSQDNINPPGEEHQRKDNWRGKDAEFRGSETPREADFNEDDDLPSLNRRRRSNKLVTAGGYFVIGALLIAVLIIMTRNAGPSEKAVPPPISNRLPALVVPNAPEPPAAVAQKVEQPKEQIEDDDPLLRKMKGNLVMQGGSSGSGSGSGGARGSGPGGQMTESERLAFMMAQSRMPNQGFIGPDGQPVGGMGGANDNSEVLQAGGAGSGSLGQRLKPTITEAVSATVLPRRDYLLAKGATLDCALETAINTSVPAMTTCRLTRDVYSDNGRVLLLDRGTQLVGEYAGQLGRGQARMFLLWTRAKTPSGVVVNLNSPGIDALGRGGITGYVDNHFWERFGAAIMTSFLKDTVNTVVGNRTQKEGGGGNTNIYTGSLNSGNEVVSAMLREQANIPPTLIVNQGEHVQVMVARDLDFSEVYGLRTTN